MGRESEDVSKLGYFDRLRRAEERLVDIASRRWLIEWDRQEASVEMIQEEVTVSVVVIDESMRGVVKLTPHIDFEVFTTRANRLVTTYEGPVERNGERVGPKLAVQLMATLLRVLAVSREVLGKDFQHAFLLTSEDNERFALALRNELGYAELEPGHIYQRIVDEEMVEAIWEVLGRDEAVERAGRLVAERFGELEQDL